jgi:hypothetical protein
MRISFLMDPDPGHIFPVIGLANALTEAGHEVHLLGIADIRSLMQNTKASFHAVFTDIYPPGFLNQYKKMQLTNRGAFLTENDVPRPHLASLIGGDVPYILHNSGLLIVVYSLPLEAVLLKHLIPNYALHS